MPTILDINTVGTPSRPVQARKPGPRSEQSRSAGPPSHRGMFGPTRQPPSTAPRAVRLDGNHRRAPSPASTRSRTRSRASPGAMVAAMARFSGASGEYRRGPCQEPSPHAFGDPVSNNSELTSGPGLAARWDLNEPLSSPSWTMSPLQPPLAPSSAANATGSLASSRHPPATPRRQLRP